jgi:hypothetical protein
LETIMPKLALLPLIIVTVSALLTWAMAKHLELVSEQRAHAATRPRGRPYGTNMPDLLGR